MHEGQKFQCPQCEYKASEKGSLKKHIKSIHEGQKFPCPHCEYKAAAKRSLPAHIKSIHEGQKFQCPHCELKATFRVNLQRHMLIQSNKENTLLIAYCPDLSQTGAKCAKYKHFSVSLFKYLIKIFVIVEFDICSVWTQCHPGAILLMWCVEVVLDGLALNMGLSHHMTSWPHYCFQGIVDLLRVFWWLGSRFGAP